MTALSMAANGMEKVMKLDAIVVFTTSGRSAMNIAAERPKAPVYALTTHPQVYHALNLLWGVNPLLISEHPHTFEQFVSVAEITLKKRNFVKSEDNILILGGIPAHEPGGANFLKIHRIG
jgi:pyruvate kinase